MRAVERTRHIDVSLSGSGVDFVIDALRASFPKIKIFDSDEDFVDASSSDWFNSIEVSPADALRLRRENAGLSQAELSAKTGIAVPNICAMESGARKIGLATAKKLAGAFGCSVSCFVG